MFDFQLNLTSEERELLVEILSRQLKEKRVEEHRTDSMAFKEIVARQGKLVEEMLHKLGPVAVG